ncbi:MAG: (Fe-S)-binding protein [Spirochaetes bacterium]|nr:(Fe-S)-binding protein [Spirochaetota bacterium]
MENIINQISLCTQCGKCLDSCPTYQITGDALFSPLQRLQTVSEVLDGGLVSGRMIESLYNCTKCMACETFCPEDIKISKIVAAGRQKLVKRGLGPLPRGKKIIEGLLKSGNAVSGNPEKRLDWLPEPFTRTESDTLLFLGCLPSFLVKDSASSSYLALKRLGIDFMILEDEGCCGTYIYEAGNVPMAKEYFQKNADRFTSLGIKNIIVPCNGCMKCFKYFYPEVLGEFPFQVSHVIEAIYNKVKEDSALLNKIERTVTYQDACRLARGEKMTEQPRELLSWCGCDVKNLKVNRKQSQCCGSGGGVRSLYRDLSDRMAIALLNTATEETLVSSCPFCTFQLRSAARINGIKKEITYFSTLVLESLNE